MNPHHDSEPNPWYPTTNILPLASYAPFQHTNKLFLQDKVINYEKESHCAIDDNTVKSMIDSLKGFLSGQEFGRFESGQVLGFMLALRHVGIIATVNRISHVVN